MTMPLRNPQAQVTLSLREARMIVERILLTTGLPMGFVPAVANCVLYAQAMRLGGLAALLPSLDALTAARRDRIGLVEDETGAGALDAGGAHAWIVAHDALDLALADFRRGEGGALRVRHVRAADELRVIEGLAKRQRARAVFEQTDAGGGLVRITGDGLPGPDPIMQAVLRDGFPVPHALWRELYARSGEALTPDSIESRRHAGPVMVDADGRVHGRDDDDTDFELLVGTTPAAPLPMGVRDAD
jgi:hypothetical protein